VERKVSGDSVIYVEDKFFPVIIATWEGTADVGNCMAFAAWHERQVDRASREGARLISISDSAHAQRPPPTVRKFFAEWMARLESEPDDPTLAIIVVVTNALMRGALTAIGWVRPEVSEMVVVPDIGSAISNALALLASANYPAPAGLDPATYRSPAQAATAMSAPG
jgi:hypothetical protein